MMNSQYLAITIGPIYRTLLRARKTRELWGASFIFSLLMRELLNELSKDPAYTLILPHFTPELAEDKWYGAGIWPDRCILSVDGDAASDIDELSNKVFSRIGSFLNMSGSDLKPFFQIYALRAVWDWDQMARATDEKDRVAVHRINRLLDNLELRAVFQNKEDRTLNDYIEEHIYPLYDQGFNQKEGVFIDLGKNEPPRLPSLPEIAAREFRVCLPDVYYRQFEDPISQSVRKHRERPGRDVGDSEKENEQIFLGLPKELKDRLLLRHKYIAIVKADGDNLGKIITALSQSGGDHNALIGFSEKLMRFSKTAVEKVVEYGGLPVYAGGDDLLFIAPVVGGKRDFPNIFALCRKLDEEFRQIFEGPTLSFGVSITYYKFPLGEALALAQNLLDRAKEFGIFQGGDREKPVHEKHALAFQVQRHSGQRFGGILKLEGQSYAKWLTLLKAKQKVDEAFLSSIMHKLERLPTLLADACKRQTLESFQKNHFNEGGHQNNAYLKEALELAQSLFDEYGDTLPQTLEESLEKRHKLAERKINAIDFHKTNLLYAALRTKQFLIQPDHD